MEKSKKVRREKRIRRGKEGGKKGKVAGKKEGKGKMPVDTHRQEDKNGKLRFNLSSEQTNTQHKEGPRSISSIAK